MGRNEDHQEKAGPTVVQAARRPRHRKGDNVKMVAVLARGGTQQEAADDAGISVREVRRREQEPAIRRQIRSVRREHQRQIMAKLADAGMVAIDKLVELSTSGQKQEIQFKAAKELLHAGTRNLESFANREELDELHDQFAALSKAEDSLAPGS
jgi:hypothetical protein